MWYKNIAGRFFGLVTKHAYDTTYNGSKFAVFRLHQNRTITQTQQMKMHILNQGQVNLIYNTSCNLFLWIKNFIFTTDLYDTTADRWSFHLPNRNKERTFCIQISR